MIDLLTAPMEAARANALSRIGMVVLMTGFLIFFFGSAFAAVTGAMNPVLPTLVGFLLLAIGGMVFAWLDVANPEAPSRTPSQPSSLPVRLVCPNCGGALRTMERAEIVTCEYCGTRFVVR